MADTNTTNFLDNYLAPAADQPPAANPALDFVRDPNARDALVAADRGGNNLALQGFGKDLINMDYGSLSLKYGEDVARNRFRLQGNVGEQSRILNTSRTSGQQVGDAALSAASGFVGLVGGAEALIASPFSSEFATQLAVATNDATAGIQSFSSQQMQDRRQQHGLMGQLDSIGNDLQSQAEINAGSSEFMAGLRNIYRDAVDNNSRILSDGAMVGDIAAQALGSLGPSSKAVNLANRIAARYAGRSAIAKGLAAPLAIGATEAGGVYQQTVTEVMEMSFSQLSNTSEEFNSLVEGGMTQDKARTQIANSAGQRAAAIQFPIATITGVGVAKFEAAPIAALSSGLGSITKNLGTQTLEEAFQGATGQLNTNAAIAASADKNRRLATGVGEQIASGAIGGAGMVGVLGAPQIARSAIDESLQTIAGITEGVTSPNIGVRDKVNTGGGGAQSNPTLTRIAGRLGGKAAAGTVGLSAAALASDPSIAIAKAVGAGTAALARGAGAVLTSEPVGAIAGGLARGGVSVARGAGKVATSEPVKATASAVIAGSLGLARGVGNAATSEPVKATGRGLARGVIATGRVAADIVTSEPSKAIARSAGRGISTVAGVSARTALGVVTSEPVKSTGKALGRAALTGGAVALGTGFDIATSEPARAIGVGIAKGGSKLASRAANKTLGVSAQAVRGISSSISSRITKYQETKKEVSPELTSVAMTDISSSVPKELSGSIEGNSSTVSVLAGSINFLHKKAGRVSEFSNRSALFISEQYARLSETVDKLPPEVSQEAKSLLSAPGFKVILDYAKAIDQNDGKTRAANKDTAAESISLAKLNPANVDPKLAGKLLNQSDKLNISPEDRKLLEASKKVAEAINANVDQQAAIQKEKISKLSKQPEYQGDGKKNLPRTPATSRSIRDDGYANKQGKRLRSINDFVSDITQGATNPDGSNTYVDSEGFKNSAKKVAVEMRDFVQHMINKVGAVNESFNNNSDKGTGKKVYFDTLVDGKFISGSEKVTVPVVIHARNANSRALGQGIYADALTAIEAYNALAEAHPKLFEGDYVQKPELAAGLQIGVGQEGQTTATEPNQTPAPVENAATAKPKTQGFAQQEKLPKMFDETFSKVEPPVAVDKFTDAIEDPEAAEAFQTMIDQVMPIIVKRMNQRLKDVVFSKKDGRSVQQHILDGEDLTHIKKTKNTAIVNQETGEYNPELLRLAVLSMIDWLANSRPTSFTKLDKISEILGIPEEDLTWDIAEAFNNGAVPKMATESIARTIIKAWGADINLDAPENYIRGITEGLSAEILTVMDEGGIFIKMVPLPYTYTNKEGKTGETTVQIIDTSKAQNFRSVVAAEARALQIQLTPEINKALNIGTPPKFVATTQSRLKNAILSALERRATKKIQNIPHLMNLGLIQLVEAFGEKNLKLALGSLDTKREDLHPRIQASVAGKNISNKMDYLHAFEVITALRAAGNDTPIFYEVVISMVGRHLFMGINPQNNKILRALVSPTKAILDMTTRKHQDAFWLTVAQASGIYKVENVKHSEVLGNIQSKFKDEFGAAVDAVIAFNNGAELDVEVLKAALGTDTEMQVLAAIHAVAELQQSKDLTKFETSLSFELDGKTDGSGNMMVNFGRGLLSAQDMDNFNKVGFFLGKIGTTLNDYFSTGRSDLYDTVSKVAQKVFTDRINALGRHEAGGNETSPSEYAILKATQRFAAHFGDFKINDNGDIEMTRETSKSPVTKTVYGAGDASIGLGIANHMLKGFYMESSFVPDGVKLADHLGYPELASDLKMLFGNEMFMHKGEVLINQNIDLPKGAKGPKDFTLSPENVKAFKSNITLGYAKLLSQTSKEVMGGKITEVIKTTIQATNIQSIVLIDRFNQNLSAEIASQRASGKIGKGDILSPRDYQKVVDSVEGLGAILSSGDQELNIASFSETKTDFHLSSNMDEKMNQRSNMYAPATVGVKAIPYMSIGRGDAMMMNIIYGGEGDLSNSLPIFDGIDVSIDKIGEYSKIINGAVSENWDRDVLIDLKDSFDGFMLQNPLDGLSDGALEAISELMGRDNQLSPEAILENTQRELTKYHRENQARKAVFAKIPASVDHMGGSGVPFARNAEAYTGTDMTVDEINALIQEELSSTSKEGDSKPDKQFSKLRIIQAENMHRLLVKTLEAGNPTRKLLQILTFGIPRGVPVVFGSLKKLNQYRRENYPQDGQEIKGNGQIDLENNVIYIHKNDPETMAHELVHLVTMQTVLDHYQGNLKNETKTDAVTRLEGLLKEFMALDFSKKAIGIQQSADAAKIEILKHLENQDAFGKAAALNEFMAWSLTNQDIVKALKTVRTSTLIGKAVYLMRRLIGNVTKDMYSNILFNTEVLIGRGITKPDNHVSVVEKTITEDLPDNSETTRDRWVDRIYQAFDAVNPSSKVGQPKAMKLNKLIEDADEVIHQLDQAGFGFSSEQRTVFRAIHMSMAAGMGMNTSAVLGLYDVYGYIVGQLTPGMFLKDPADQNKARIKRANDQYDTLMNLFGSTQNAEGISDAVAVLLAMSQTSKLFKAALEQIPAPKENSINKEDLNSFLGSSAEILMDRLTNNIRRGNGSNGGSRGIMNALADGFFQEEQDREFTVLRKIMNGADIGDKLLSGLMLSLSDKTTEINSRIQKKIENSDPSLPLETVGALAQVVDAATNFLNPAAAENQAATIKDFTHMGVSMKGLAFVREFISELVGADKINKGVITMLDKVNRDVSSVRQAYKERLPVVLQKAFKQAPSKEQWSDLHEVLGKTDVSALLGINNLGEIFRLIKSDNYTNNKITDLENSLKGAVKSSAYGEIIKKAKQLANFMNGEGSGVLLLRNAHAINTLSGDFQENLTGSIDQLISLYALRGLDTAPKEAVTELFGLDPEATTNLLVYIAGLNKEENQKVISEAAKMNGYKGYIPEQNQQGSRLVIKKDTEKQKLKELGFTRIGDYSGDADFSSQKRGYYFSSVKQGGSYSQGVLQGVQDTFRGVDANTGLTITGDVSGVISGDVVETLTWALNKTKTRAKETEGLLPVFDNNGVVEFYERSMDPALVSKFTKKPSHLGLMLGAWAGRQVEEKLAEQYNEQLVDELKGIYDDRVPGTENLFINLAQKDIKDQIHRENWKRIPPKTKRYIESQFGASGFPVRSDMTNMSLGYSEPSITDMWTGKGRMPKAVQKTVTGVATMLMGDLAMTILSRTEQTTQTVVSVAKDNIIIKSLVVPYMNIQANVFQLVIRRVPIKSILKGSRDKFAEVETYNKNITKIIDLETQVELFSNQPNKVRILENRIKTLEDNNRRMSIWPLIEAGAYKNISEGITDLDVDLSSGRFGQWLENQTSKLPVGVQTIAKYGLLTKDTAIYKGANRAIQYGDFIAKAVYYEHLLKDKGMSHDEAMLKVNEEFVNFSVLPGRTRSYLESMGLTWFLTFKIRIAKIAMQQIRDNPFRALVVNAAVGDLGSPIEDNLFSVYAQDRLNYSLGWDMLFGSAGLNPWYNATH